jgi:signal transduction histidine kinase/ActR/RegA family two-component response regulator
MVGVLIALAVIKTVHMIQYPGANTSDDIAFALMQVVNVLVPASAFDWIIRIQKRLHRTNTELETVNAELLASNEELAAREEEISQQNEELQSQAEEMEQQAEELRTQSHELQLSNEELASRESTLEALLELAAPVNDETTLMRRLCDLALRLSQGAEASAVLLRDGDVFRIMGYKGLGDGVASDRIAVDRAFATLVLERGVSGVLEDKNLRPDLDLPRSDRGDVFRCAFAAPITLDGQKSAVLEIYSRSSVCWNADNIRLIEWLATQCGRLWEAIRLRQQLDDRVAERTAQLSHMASEMTLTEQRERRRLATELHDHLAQMLAVSRMRLAKINGDPAVVEQLRNAIDQAIAYTRSLMADLAPAMLYDFGLVAALGKLAEKFQREQDLTVKLHHDGDEPALGEDLRIVLFQGVRELLFNIVKHAGVNKADVRISTCDGEVVVEVEDAGRGFVMPQGRATAAPSAGGGFGLLSIRERLQLLGGSMTVRSVPGDGTHITLTAPLAVTAPVVATPAPLTVAPVTIKGQATRVLLGDDHAMFRQSLAHLLSSNSDIAVVGQAENGRVAVEMAHRLHPDVVVMDVNMPVMNGVEATRLICSQLPSTRVIGVTINVDEQVRAALTSAGAVACLPKDGEVNELLTLLRQKAAPVAVN